MHTVAAVNLSFPVSAAAMTNRVDHQLPRTFPSIFTRSLRAAGAGPSLHVPCFVMRSSAVSLRTLHVRLVSSGFLTLVLGRLLVAAVILVLAVV